MNWFISQMPLALRRFLAFSIDFFLIGLTRSIFAQSFVHDSSLRFSFLKPAQLTPLFKFSDEVFGLPLVGIIFLVYHFIFLYCFKGATPGAQAMDIQIQSRSDDETDLNLAEAMSRTISLFGSAIFLGLPSMICLSRQDRRCGVDLISSTIVHDLQTNNETEILPFPIPVTEDSDLEKEDYSKIA